MGPEVAIEIERSSLWVDLPITQCAAKFDAILDSAQAYLTIAMDRNWYLDSTIMG